MKNQTTLTKEEFVEGLRESHYVECKQFHYEGGKYSGFKDSKQLLIREVCAFSNADGGVVLIGIGEDENKNPTEIIDCGVDESTFEEWSQGFFSTIKKLIIPAIEPPFVELLSIENKNVIQVKVQKGASTPYSYKENITADIVYFPKRFGNQIRHLDYYEIKNEFSSREVLFEKAEKFREKRISELLSGEVTEETLGNTFLVLHAIPLWSMYSDSRVDTEALGATMEADIMNLTLNNRAGYPKPNNLGTIILSSYDQEMKSFAQLFWNGVIEIVEIRQMNLFIGDSQPTLIANFEKLGLGLAKCTYNSFIALEKIEVPKPYVFYTSILNAKGKQSLCSYPLRCPEVPFSSNRIDFPLLELQSIQNFDLQIKPLLTTFSGVFGASQSAMYDYYGKPIAEKFTFLASEP